jgi:phosphomannomutase
MAQKQGTNQRSCPGEKYAISPAICRTRQRNQYPKCLLCHYREAGLAGSSASDPKVSSKIFRATAVLGRVPDQINEYVMRKVGLATAQFLRAENPSGSRLVVGCDGRENSRGFARIFCEGINRSGADAVTVGAAPPDLVAFLFGTGEFSGAAFVSGWNAPENANGVRLWRHDGRIVGFGSGLEKVGLIARRLRMACSRLPGEIESAAPLSEYVAYMAKYAPEMRPVTVAVAPGSSAAEPVLRPLFDKLPARLVLARRGGEATADLGEGFPSEAACEAVRAAVRDTRADLGAALDFAGSRIAFFDQRGSLLRHDVAAGLIASEMLARSPDSCITYDLRSTAMLRARIASLGGEPLSAPASRLAFANHFRRNEAIYGADLSGLHYFKSFFGFPSPFLALLMLASYVGREGARVTDLAGELGSLSRAEDVRIPLPDGDEAEGVLARVRDEFSGAERDMIDGVTVRQKDWWFNLRQPGNASELRLTVEARDHRRLRRGRQTVEKLVQKALSAPRT